MKRRLTIIICALLLVNNGHTTEGGGLADFLSELDKALDKLCNTVAPTTNDTVTGRKTINTYNREQQIAKGNAIAKAQIKELQKQNIRINDFNPWMYRRVQRIAERILAVSHLRNEKWFFVLVDDPEFNAYVTGGSVLFINRGAVENSSNDEIAAVIGHEIAHVAANHMFERISHLDIASITGSNSAKREWFQVAFGHNQEIEADKYGLLYTALAGHDPFVAPKFWKRMLQKNGNGGFMRSHPANSERMQLTERFARKWNSYHISGKQYPNFARILESQKEANISDNTEVGKGGGIVGCADTYINAKEQHELAKREEQRQKQQQALAKKREEQRQRQQQAASIAHANFVNKVSQLISIKSMYVLSPTALQIDLYYEGDKPVNVEMMAVLTEIGKDSRIGAWILNPGTWITPSYSVVLEFDSSVFANWRYGEQVPQNYLDRNIRVKIIDAKLANS